MPLTVKEGALIGAGMWAATAATIFYRQKKTLPFKIAYFASWPLLGTAVLLAATPGRDSMEQKLQERGVDPEAVAAGRAAAAAQLEQLRQVAAGGKAGAARQEPPQR